ncbi:hypothetical protein RDWZM_003093 [Blomia tropicalis]|uniref:Pyridoxal kinase n=1 Tax=Blomia tropicalis TaxID=40697 RepID=A0A9Q0MG67_BLOTA|nr:hypothetical protein BLOT_000867 [Blomia tropicalis]KAJ6224548.1 hypothetical protein RDWZM_003093 [Blomia tropicalis]
MLSNEHSSINGHNQTNEPRVLSIQSHVVSGYCGNKSAVFPLQTLGFDVDFINSVQFSNHTGYGTWKGQVLNETELRELYDGLKQNGLDRFYTHLLTGYARSPSFLEAMHSVIGEIKSNQSNAIYLCDPVLGDNGRLYVPKELVPIFRDKIIPLADIITPNQFEAELLSESKITDLKSALNAIDILHGKGIRTVVISSTDEGFNQSDPKNLTIIASSNHTGTRQLYSISIPRVSATFVGTGDLFAALFLAWFTKTSFNLKIALENVVATLQSIIQRTIKFAENRDGGTTKRGNVELKIIQGRNDILEPNVAIRCNEITI